MSTIRVTIIAQAIVLACLAAVMVSRAPTSININVTGQTVTVAAPDPARPEPRVSRGTKGWIKGQGPGVGLDFVLIGPTGGWGHAQDMLRNNVSRVNEFTQ